MFSRRVGKWHRFDPLGEVLGSGDNLFMFVGGRWMDDSNQTKAPLIKRPWCGQRVELLGWCMNKVTMDLAFFAGSSIVDRILFHGWLERAHPKNLFC